MFWVHIYEQQPRRIRIVTRDPNILETYDITFNNLYTQTFSDNFPHNDKCSICLEEFVFDDDNVVETTNCNHCFHEECIKRWLRIRTTCPNCQQNLVALYITNNF